MLCGLHNQLSWTREPCWSKRHCQFWHLHMLNITHTRVVIDMWSAQSRTCARNPMRTAGRRTDPPGGRFPCQRQTALRQIHLINWNSGGAIFHAVASVERLGLILVAVCRALITRLPVLLSISAAVAQLPKKFRGLKHTITHHRCSEIRDRLRSRPAVMRFKCIMDEVCNYLCYIFNFQ